MTEKAALRREMLVRRRGMETSEVAEKSEAIRNRLAELPELEGSGIVLAFRSIGNEPDLLPLMEVWVSAGLEVLIPELQKTADSTWMVWKPRRSGTSLEELVPPRDAIVLVPGVAFTAKGERLGLGGGHFDRFLAGHGGLSIGVAYEWQIVEALPVEAHDVAVDVVVTEMRTYRRREIS